jgi:hypothetical protein
MAEIKTVKVKDEGTSTGFRIINESDFVKGKHQLWTEPKKADPDTK